MNIVAVFVYLVLFLCLASSGLAWWQLIITAGLIALARQIEKDFK